MLLNLDTHPPAHFPFFRAQPNHCHLPLLLDTTGSSTEIPMPGSNAAEVGSLNETMMHNSDSDGSTHEVFVRGTLISRDIAAIDIATAGKRVERAKDYKGRRKIWPGLLLLALAITGAAYLITDFAMDVSEKAATRQKAYAEKESEELDISSGTDGSTDTTVGTDIVSDDGVVGNPKSYPKSGEAALMLEVGCMTRRKTDTLMMMC
jgi:hypothetical protein